MIMGAVR